MTPEELASSLGVEVKKLDDKRYAAEVPPNRLREAVKAIISAGAPTYLCNITGIDHAEKGIIALHYNFWLSGGYLLSLKVSIPRDNAEVDTICDIMLGAFVHELEVYDLLGVKFRGNDDLWEPAFKPPEFKGEHPLRKDWKMRCAEDARA